MASQTTTTPKRVSRAAGKTTTKTARPARKESETPTNGNKRAKSGSRAKTVARDDARRTIFTCLQDDLRPTTRK